MRHLASAALILALSPALTEAFFLEPGKACNPHRRQQGAALSPADKWHQWPALRQLCTDDAFIPAFVPRTCPWDLYPGEVAAPPGAPAQCEIDGPWWPQQVDPADPSDPAETFVHVYRYPLVDTATPRTHQDHRVDRWDVCAGQDLSSIEQVPHAFPPATNCPAGTEKLGECVASAHDYERLLSKTRRVAGNPAGTFFSFVLTHPDCSPEPYQRGCGHEMRSAIDTCKGLCEAYFESIHFDPSAGLGLGAWEPITPGVDVPAGEMPIKHRKVTDRLVDHCKHYCGPPYAEPVDPSDPLGPQENLVEYSDPTDNATQVEPWVSHSTKTKRPRAEDRNHWQFVSYRRWQVTPNVHGALRSYTVNQDKRYAPANMCADLTDLYCKKLVKEAELPGAVAGVCRRRQLAGSRFNDNEKGFGFCAHFYQGHYLCPDTCHVGGADADVDEADNRVCAGDPTTDYDFAQQPRALPLPEQRRPFRCEQDAVCRRDCPHAGTAPELCKYVALFAVGASDQDGAQATVAASSVTLRAYFHDREGQLVTGLGGVPAWENSTTAGSGTFVPDGSLDDVWVTAASVPLGLGSNELVATFRDDVGNDFTATLEVIRQP